MKVAVAVALLLSLVAIAYGSSHSEAPGTARQPQSDATDFYMFRSYESARINNNENFVTFLFNVQGLQAPYAGPNYFSFSDSHYYEIYIDTNGDAIEDQVFQFMYGTSLGGANVNQTIYPADFDCNFNPYFSVQPGGITVTSNVGSATVQNVAIPLKFAAPITASDNSGLNWFEYYYLSYIHGDRNSQNKQYVVQSGTSNNKFTKPFDNAGEKSFPDYESYADQYIYDVTYPFCNKDGKVFVGQRYEGFFINLGAIFDLINMVPIPGFPGAIQSSPLNNDLIDKNIGTFALEVPTSCLTSGDVIGAWTAIRQLKHASNGSHIPGAQVSRLGNPLINELIIGLRDKFAFNLGDPINDVTDFGTYVLYPSVPILVDALFGATVNSVLGTNLATIAPNTPRSDLLIFVEGIAGINKFPGSPAAGEMLRLNVSIAPVAWNAQTSRGVIAGDAAGFPNGRRPGDDIVDVALQVVAAGVLCTLPLGYCNSSAAPIGGVLLNDGTPISGTDFLDAFPYLHTPLPGAKNGGKNLSSSPSSGLTFPSLLAVGLALVAGFFISFGFFA